VEAKDIAERLAEATVAGREDDVGSAGNISGVLVTEGTAAAAEAAEAAPRGRQTGTAGTAGTAGIAVSATPDVCVAALFGSGFPKARSPPPVVERLEVEWLAITCVEEEAEEELLRKEDMVRKERQKEMGVRVFRGRTRFNFFENGDWFSDFCSCDRFWRTFERMCHDDPSWTSWLYCCLRFLHLP